MGRELPTNLVRRGARIWVRVEVPKDVRAAYGKAVVFESTGHDDDRKGRAAGLARLAELQAQWATLRGQVEVDNARRTADAGMLRSMAPTLALDLYARELAEDDRNRLDLPTAEQLETMRAEARKSRDPVSAAFDFLAARGAADYDRDRRSRLLQELRQHLGSGETVLVSDMAAEITRRDGLAVERGSIPWRELCRDLTRAWIAALEAQEGRDVGDYGRTPRDPLLTARPQVAPLPRSAKPEPVARSGDIMSMYAKFEELNPYAAKPDTLKYGRPIVRLFAESMPRGALASDITKAAVVDWLDLLARWPIKASEMGEFRGMTFREIIARNDASPTPKPAISKKSINKYLSSLSSFCKWLNVRDVIQGNPVPGLLLKVDDETSRRPYTAAELNVIFRSPLYAGFKEDGKEHVPGFTLASDWRLWLPLLGLYTGARLGELAQLLTADVRQEGETWVIYVTDEGDDDKSVKTAGSRRVLPIHAELIRLGFLAHHARIAAAGERRLFPELLSNTRNQISGTPSRWWSRFTERIGVKTDRDLVFHSFRHGLADEFRRLGYLDHDFAFILGHTDERTTVTRGYGILGHGNLARRVEMMSKVEFPGLDLAHL